MRMMQKKWKTCISSKSIFDLLKFGEKEGDQQNYKHRL